MALKPTIYKIKINLSDFNRDYYDTLNMTVAQHPSETIQRMMVRVLVFCLNAQEQLSFTKGLSATDEPDLWVKTLDDQLLAWIDVGEPAVDRIKKASRLASQVKVYSFNSKSDVWWSQEQKKYSAFKNVSVYQFKWSDIETLSAIAGRSMELVITITESSIYISNDDENIEVLLLNLQP